MCFQLYLQFAEPYQLHDMKLLILKVSEHRDTHVVTSTWRSIFADGLYDLLVLLLTSPDTAHRPVAEANPSTPAPAVLADRIRRLGHQLYPSDIAFPIGS